MSPVVRRVSRVATWFTLIATGGTILAATAKAVKSGADHHFVQRDTFTAYRADQIIQHIRDSINADARWTRVDTSIAELLRACQHRGECP